MNQIVKNMSIAVATMVVIFASSFATGSQIARLALSGAYVAPTKPAMQVMKVIRDYEPNVNPYTGKHGTRTPTK